MIKLSGCSYREIPLPLLEPEHVVELVMDLQRRALGDGDGSNAAASIFQHATVSPLTSIVSFIPIRRSDRRPAIEAAAPSFSSPLSSFPAYHPLPPLLGHLLELMAGHPRMLEYLLVAIGSPDGVDEFRRSILCCWARPTTPAEYAELAAKIRAAYNRKFFNPETGNYSDGSRPRN